jgi:carboxypeptidase C (cathepsin A)
MRSALVAAVCVASCLPGAEAMKDEDRIDGRALPGWKCMAMTPPFAQAAGERCLPSRHYSGYLDISEARDESKMLHYWFVEAEQVDPATAPVTLWLNGGPGCSSMDGFFYEMGPLHVNDRDFNKLDHNPHAWTTISNMIYLEAPVGVGFSYHTLDRDYAVNDNSTAAMNYMGLKRFFENFQEYKNNPLYLSGESYAGIYIPTLAEQVLWGRDAQDPDIWSKPWLGEPQPLQGILVGNGCNGEETWSCGSPPAEVIEAYARKMRVPAFVESPAAVRVNFLHDHAIISQASYDNIMEACMAAPADFNTRTQCRERRYGEVADGDPQCGYERRGEFRMRGPYNDTDCCHSEDRYAKYYCDTEDGRCGGTPYYSCDLSPFHPMANCCEAMDGYDDDIGDLDVYGLYEYCAAGPEDNARRQGRQGNLTWSEEAKESMYESSRFDREETVENELYGLGGCWGGTESATEYLNRDDVRAAIHVMSRQQMTDLYGDDGADWAICASRSGNFNYDRGYTHSLMPRYPYLVANIRVMIFSGDVDACVPYTGTQKWTEELAMDNQWPMVEPWHAWTVQDQVGGYVTVYDATPFDFTFVTVFGAGHMVPQTQPRKALALFDRYINDKGWEPPQKNPVQITSPPVPVSVFKGQRVTLNIEVAGGSLPYLYQWYKDGALLPGETMHEMTIPTSEACHVGQYHVRVEEMDGTFAVSERVQVAVATSVDGCLTHECTADEIKSLPGWDKPFPSKQYSGYIDVTPDCVGDLDSAPVSCAAMDTPFTGKRMLHYWFVEAEQVDPGQAPVVLWLNGGPGCSSMGGLFTEMGPWRVNEEDPREVGHNAHTWCGPANMIYLESPIGVGFSYTTESAFGRNVTVNDNSTAEMNYLFMKRFYDRYPQFAANELYLTGESYAGIYVPTLAEQIMFGQDRGETISNGRQMNLQGMMVGNGCTGTDTVSCGERPNIENFLDSAAGIELTFAHQHALISDDLFEEVIEHCPAPLGRRDCSEKVYELPTDPFLADKCRGPRVSDGRCHWYCPKPRSDPNFACCDAQRRYEDDMGTLNIYGIYDTCKDDPQVNATAELERVQAMCASAGGGRRVQETEDHEEPEEEESCHSGREEARLTGPQNMYDTVKLLKPHREAAWMHEMGLADSDDMYAHGLSGCWGGSDGLTQWLNRDDVRAAIHVVSQQEMKDMYGDSERSYLWRDCGMKNVDYERGATSTLLPRFPALIERYHVLIFSGDVDACVPYIGTQSWTADVAAENQYTPVDQWHPWTVDGQVGGYVSSWRTADDKEFTFATVYHAGHMVPKDEPVKGLALFDRFIGQKGWNPTVTPIEVSSQQPAGGPLDVEHNSRVSFRVTVHGGAKPYIYQWLKVRKTPLFAPFI